MTEKGWVFVSLLIALALAAVLCWVAPDMADWSLSDQIIFFAGVFTVSGMAWGIIAAIGPDGFSKILQFLFLFACVAGVTYLFFNLLTVLFFREPLF